MTDFISHIFQGKPAPSPSESPSESPTRSPSESPSLSPTEHPTTDSPTQSPTQPLLCPHSLDVAVVWDLSKVNEAQCREQQIFLEDLMQGALYSDFVFFTAQPSSHLSRPAARPGMDEKSTAALGTPRR